MTWGALEGRLRMFSTEELAALDRYPEPGNCIIFHKHRASHPYHRHGRAGSLRQAVKSIQGHDRYQIEVREGGGRKEGSREKEAPH